MTAWMLRAIFATTLVATVALRLHADDVLGANVLGSFIDIKPGVIQLLQSHGLVYRGSRIPGGGPLISLVFDAPGCSRGVQVVPVSVTFEESPLLRFVDEPGDKRRFFYLDRSSLVEDRIGMFFERAEHMVLAVLGHTRYVPLRTMVMVTEPPNCHVAEEVDWRPLWDRHYLASIANG